MNTEKKTIADYIPGIYELGLFDALKEKAGYLWDQYRAYKQAKYYLKQAETLGEKYLKNKEGKFSGVRTEQYKKLYLQSVLKALGYFTLSQGFLNDKGYINLESMYAKLFEQFDTLRQADPVEAADFRDARNNGRLPNFDGFDVFPLTHPKQLIFAPDPR